MTALKVVTITVTAAGFQPNPATVTPGTNVIWIGGDAGPHIVVSGTPGHEDHKFGSSPSMGKGASFTVVLQNAGTYQYFDQSHTTLTGQIVVKSS